MFRKKQIKTTAFFRFLGSDSSSQLLPGFPSLDFQWDPQGAHKRTDQKKIRRGFWKVDPLGNPICQFPGSLEGLGQPFVQQRLPPQLPRATGTPQGAHKRTDQKKTIKKKLYPVFGKSTLLGTQSFNSLALCRLWTNHSFNKDCLYSFPGPPGAHKEPTRGPTKKEFLYFFFLAAVGRKVGPLGELFGRLPGRLRALRPIIDQQIMPPELPGTHGSPRQCVR